MIFGIDSFQSFIIEDMVSEVERPGFARLMEKLVGHLVLKKRTFFTEKLVANYSNTKTRLIMALRKIIKRTIITKKTKKMRVPNLTKRWSTLISLKS